MFGKQTYLPTYGDMTPSNFLVYQVTISDQEIIGYVKSCCYDNFEECQQPDHKTWHLFGKDTKNSLKCISRCDSCDYKKEKIIDYFPKLGKLCLCGAVSPPVLDKMYLFE